MNIKGMVGAVVFVFTAALLVPLYESYNAIGYIIAGLVGCITAGISVVISGKWTVLQEERAASRSLIQNTILESKEQFNEQQERFVTSSKLIQEQLQKVISESVAFQQQTLMELKAAVNEMSLIGENQKDQTNRIVVELDGFTTHLTNLFEERIQEDLNVIRESKDLISNNLFQLRQEVEQAELRHEAYLTKLESSFNRVAEMVVTNQQMQVSQLKQHLLETKAASDEYFIETKQVMTEYLSTQKGDFRDLVEGMQSTHRNLETSVSSISDMLAANLKAQASQLKQHLSEVKVASEDHLDDTKDALNDILKEQKRESRYVMEELQSTHKSILEEITSQGTRQQANLELLQRLQQEIMDLNQQDLQLISKLMQEV
ncbi:hypothetical protein [Candidatus Pristimantibacillus sp. PTI5]|uniref:hypothetical protein n=1 Tax=Candidatus Pristimantibacillus sp. PTI5 TaxID=3400422 RepID=UPI003B012A23